MLSVIMLSVIMLSDIMLIAVMLSVVAPKSHNLKTVFEQIVLKCSKLVRLSAQNT